MTNTNPTFIPLIQGRETFAPAVRNSIMARTIAQSLSGRDYCDGPAYDGPLGSCGCYDYHMSDCPTRG